MKNIDTKILAAFFLVLLVTTVLVLIRKNTDQTIGIKSRFWNMQSIDTVKYSRDPARQYDNEPSYDKTIEMQVRVVAETGATHIAIGTPYDEEFVPFLTRWVNTARKYGLNVWFRGNFSGWEKWFDYKAITRDEHKDMLKKFILDNGSLFKDGDIFTSCTECENGGPGDPRQTGDTTGHRQFLIDEYQIARNAFSQLGKNVTANYFPMNADVAKLIMNKTTTQALGNTVVIDHYVSTPEKLNQGIDDLANSSGGKVVLGEFGAPIPDLNGNLTDTEQAAWIKRAFLLLAANKNLIGVNYWTSFGGSTRLWHDDGSATPAVKTLTDFYTPKSLRGTVKNEAGIPVVGAILSTHEQSIKTDVNGQFSIPFLADEIEVGVSATGYSSTAITNIHDNKPITVLLKKQNENLFYKLQKLLYQSLGI